MTLFHSLTLQYICRLTMISVPQLDTSTCMSPNYDSVPQLDTSTCMLPNYDLCSTAWHLNNYIISVSGVSWLWSYGSLIYIYQYDRSVVFYVTPISTTNKTDSHNITVLLLKVALSTITITLFLSLTLTKMAPNYNLYSKGWYYNKHGDIYLEQVMPFHLMIFALPSIIKWRWPPA